MSMSKEERGKWRVYLTRLAREYRMSASELRSEGMERSAIDVELMAVACEIVASKVLED